MSADGRESSRQSDEATQRRSDKGVRRAVAGIALLLAAAVVARGDDRVSNSRHDLSTFGPGPIRATSESEVCIFCHTPHNASPAAPLWNRYNPQTHYRIYQSSTTDARIDQPGPESKMCLSCHDGSVALGLVRSRDAEIPLNHPFMPTGPSNLTTDLSDDHPVGLRFDRQLASRDPQLRVPQLADSRIRLGERGELECTACHDAHNNELGDFLRLPTREGVLCLTCHKLDGWSQSAHALSARPTPAALTGGEPLPFRSMADNACGSCHVSHGAAHPERLLRDRAYDLCIACHNGSTATDVLSAAGQRHGHKPERFRERHDPAEQPGTMPPHVDCVDCHNPHAARSGLSEFNTTIADRQGALYMATMEFVPGVTVGGVAVDRARQYHEVCFRCHADRPVPIPGRIIRDRDDYGNIRRQFLPSAASAHPVTRTARNAGETPSLTPAARAQTSMNCQDCHNNPDARQLGGGGPNGPHGSPHPFLLAARYETRDFTVESPQAYQLCYQCHDRGSILGDESFSLHRIHVVDARTPCSACHTAHGVSGSQREHSHLVNFDVSIVSGERRFEDRGRFAGSCTLTCHGVRHVDFRYER